MKFQVQNDGFTWNICKESYIQNFQSDFAKQLRNVSERIKATEKIEEYCKSKMKVVISISIKRLMAQKDSDEETFFLLCGALDELDLATAPTTV